MSAFELMAATDFYALGEFEQVVLLSVLRLGENAYAVSIRDEILDCTGRDVSRGSIYITLDRLETKGFLRSRLADPTPERGGRAKSYYELRPRAVHALKESRRALVALWRGLERVLAGAGCLAASAHGCGGRCHRILSSRLPAICSRITSERAVP